MFSTPKLVYRDLYMMGVPYFSKSYCTCTLCLSGHGCDPNLTMSLHTFTTPPLPPGTPPPLPPLNANTHAGVLMALAFSLSNWVSLQNAFVANHVDGYFTLLPEIDAFGNSSKIPGERGVADQTNSALLFPKGLSITSLPAEAKGLWTALFQKAPRGSLYIPVLYLP
jgi:hypothetical protein